jgi:micrococcal nuclease
MKDFYNYRVSKVVKVYDGDTITIDIDLGFGMVMTSQSLRLYGINTPEVRGDSKEEGIRVRDYVRSVLVGNPNIYITSHKDKSGKYGRWLATVFYRPVDKEGIEYINLNQELLDKEMAVEYMK